MRIWTVSEAQAYLPRARQLVEAVRAAVTVAGHAKGNGHGGGGAVAGPPEVTAEAAVAELEAGDIILRDPQRGLIDFHAQGADGVVYYLCWLVDEPDLAWWHLPEEGFAGRKPLPRDPEA